MYPPNRPPVHKYNINNIILLSPATDCPTAGRPVYLLLA